MKQLLLLIVLLSVQSIFLNAQDKDYIEWYLFREDVNIFVKEIGTGKDTVIVVHGGFGANHDYMTDAIKGLEKKFRFFLYDQRGSVLSYTDKENLTFQKNVEDLHALVKALKLKNANIFCHSMGTLVGMEFTKQHPELVSHLVLAGTIVPKAEGDESVFTERYGEQVHFLQNREEVIELLQPYRDKGIDSLRKVVRDDSPFSHKELTEHWRIQFASTNIYDVSKYHLLKGGMAYYKPDGAAIAETVDFNYDYRDVLNDKTKTTIINGDYDFLDFNGEVLKELLKGYNNIELLIIPNAGHNSWVDNPGLFKKYLKHGLTR